jgi:NADH-quinone oxidoreductase subunit F
MKWSFMPPPDGGPRYLVVNADESEPGTCKDIPLMMANPQFLIEGVAISSFAIGCDHAFIYLRGEVVHVYRRLLRAVEEAYAAGHLGKNIHGSGFDLDVTVHAGAGAYICGEETALLDSLEGRRGQPRLKPPFPGAPASTPARPSVNNVESIASVPRSSCRAPTGSPGWAPRSPPASASSASPGTSRTPASTRPPGHHAARADRHGRRHARPRQEAEVLDPRRVLDAALHRRAPRRAAGLRVGRGRGLDARHPRPADLRRDRVVVRAVDRWTDFYKHESCGKCTPCREGTWWLKQITERLEHGQGTEEDIDKLLDICDNILGRSFCALADGATSPMTSAPSSTSATSTSRTSDGELPVRPERVDPVRRQKDRVNA